MEVFYRDGGVCQCCHSDYLLEYDHIVPFSKGGSNRACNLQLLCKPCNRSKGARDYCKIHRRELIIESCDMYLLKK